MQTARYGSGSALNYLLKEKAGRGNQKCLLLKPRVPKIGGTPEMFAHVIADQKVSHCINTDMMMAALNQAITDRNNSNAVTYNSDRGGSVLVCSLHY